MQSWTPEDSPLWRAVLGHWTESEPERVRLLFRSSKLREALNRETDKLLENVMFLKEGGLSEEQAREIVLENLAADAGEPSGTALSEEELAELRSWLWRIAEE